MIEDSDFTTFDQASKDQMLGNYLKETYLKAFFSQRAKDEQGRLPPKRGILEAILEQKKAHEVKMQNSAIQSIYD